MEKIKLEFKELTVAESIGGDIVFFLYREDMDLALPVKLTPIGMHFVFSNLYKYNTANLKKSKIATTHQIFFKSLLSFRIEVLEIVITKKEENDYIVDILLFDGEKEVVIEADLIDGIILASKFKSPIFIDAELLKQCAVPLKEFGEFFLTEKDSELQDLKSQLQKAIDSENYELAYKLNKQINKFNNE